jgi:DNA-binding GntR family transcriptional regulator
LHERYENDYLEKLKDFINLLYLDQELNSYELNYIKHFENIIFAKKRNLKNLIVDFPLSHKKEKVYYKYDAVSFCHTTVKKQMVHTIENGEFFISTKRVLFSKDTNIFAIDIQTIKDFKVSDTDLQIQTESDTFIFKTNDPYLLYVSLQRILKLLSILI